MDKTRLETFTDAVIAIIMTVMVLELARPNSDQLGSFVTLLPHIGVYFVSFFILSIYWVNHHHLFQPIRRINGRILWINIGFIFILSLIPIFSNWASHYINSFIPELCYTLIFFLGNIFYLFLTKELLKINSHIKISSSTVKKNVISLFFNVFSIILGYYIAPFLMIIGSVLVFSLWMIPDQNTERMFK